MSADPGPAGLPLADRVDPPLPPADRPDAALPFADRVDAGQRLARRLAGESLMPPIVVVGLPRGGMVVACEVARALHAPLYALLVRKIGAPWQPELAVGAVVDGPQARAVLDDHRSSSFGADSAYIAEQTRKAVEEIHRRRARYGAAAVLPSLKGQTVILVDDGVATGLTARAALQSLRSAGASSVVLAVPVAPHGSLLDLARDCDRVVCLAEPDPFHAVGCHYRSFAQVDDDTVVALLSR